MELNHRPTVDIPPGLIKSIESFPLHREVSHCGDTFTVSPFDIYAECPRCGSRLKVRSMSACPEIEDLFDAVFEWMSQPGADALVRRRQQVLAEDRD